jgi:hypothetical protein
MFTETLHELFEKFPETPKSIIIKTDIINRGIKLNIDIVNLKGFFRNFFSLDDGTSITASYCKDSPFEIRNINNEYALYYNGQWLERINFTIIPEFIQSKSKKIPFLFRGSECAYLYPIAACAYFFCKEQCQYCGFNNAWDNSPTKPEFIQNPYDYVDIINKAIEVNGLKHIKLTGGSLYNLKKEADIYVQFTKIIRENTNIKEIYAYPQAFKKEDSIRLLEAGVNEVCYDIEVWEEELWPKILPGKTKNIGRDIWLERLIDAVEVFGEGHVSSSIVAGYELAHPGGFINYEQALQSNIEGFEWLISHGIEPVFFPWTPEMPGAKNSHGRNVDALRTHEIPTSYYIQLGNELHKLLMKYKMYTKLGFENLGENPKRDRLVCYKCGYHSISQDYPRLVKDVRV